MSSSLVYTSPLAVITVVGLLDVLNGLQHGRVKVFLADRMLATSGIYHKLSFLGSFVDATGSTHFSAGE